MLELLWINVISVVFWILCGSYKHNPHSAKSSCCHMVISESSLHHSSHSDAKQSSPSSRALPISLFAGRKPSRRTTTYIGRQRTFNWWTDGEDKNRSLPGLIYKLLLWEALPLASQYAPHDDKCPARPSNSKH